MRGYLRLRLRIGLIVVAGAVVVAAGVAFLLNNAVSERHGEAAAAQANTSLLRVVDVERLVVDAETGLRGYVITGRPLFLQPLNGAQARLQAAIAALQRAEGQDRLYPAQTATFIGSVRAYMTGYVPQTIQLAGQDLPAARSVAVTFTGKQLVDGIRARAAQLERSLGHTAVLRTNMAHSTADRSITEAIVVLVVLTLLTVGLGSYLGHLAVERERAREQSERTSRILQQSILPPVVPPIPGCELATRFIPGGEAVSGDFYDMWELEPGSWALIIGDVSGKGPAAAAATAMARWTLRSSLAVGASPSEALEFLNLVVLRQDENARFITAVCLKLQLEPDSARAEIASAGHPAPILVPRVGSPQVLEVGGDLLGLAEDIRLRTTEVELELGDSLVAYTDGVTDQGPESRRSPEQALREREVGADAEALAARLEALAHQPAGAHPDDIAILALRFVGQHPEMGSRLLEAQAPSIDA